MCIYLCASESVYVDLFVCKREYVCVSICVQERVCMFCKRLCVNVYVISKRE